MEKFKYFSITKLAFVIFLVFNAIPAKSQSSSSICTGAMIRSFTPCISFLSFGSNASSPTSNCCDSLRSLMSNGQDCLCLIVTGGQPFQVPINRTLAISLPRACRMSGVPIECKAVASPVPAPDPGNSDGNGPNDSPGLSPPSPAGPFGPQPFSPPGGGFPQPFSPPGGGFGPQPLTPPGGGFAPPRGDIVPTLTPPGMRPTLTPTSSAKPYQKSLSSLLVFVLGVFLLKCY